MSLVPISVKVKWWIFYIPSCNRLTFLISCSASAQTHAVLLSGSLSLEVEHGRFRFRPWRASGKSLNRSPAATGTDSADHQAEGARGLVVIIQWDEEADAEGRVLRAVHLERVVGSYVLDLPGHVRRHAWRICATKQQSACCSGWILAGKKGFGYY